MKKKFKCWCGNTFKTDGWFKKHTENHRIHNEEGDFKPKGSREHSRYSFAYNKRMVLNRDNFTCRVCGKENVTINLDRGYFPTVDIHHIIPRKDGGSNHVKNLITLCKDCHKKTFKNKYKGIPIKIRKLESYKGKVL